MYLTRTHFVLAFIALMLLRIMVGFHFYKEGTDKLKAGDWTAEYFLKAAKGPWAEHFHRLAEEPRYAKWQFCLSEDGKSLDSTFTKYIWDDHLNRATQVYKFGDKKLEQKLVQRRKELAQKILKARADRDPEVDSRKLETMRAEDEAKLKRLRKQTAAAEKILATHLEELDYWLAANETEVLAWFSTADRGNGFDRDGESRKQVATYVASLRDQVYTIQTDREKQKRGWQAEINEIWDSFESQIKNLALPEQVSTSQLNLHRPFDQPNRKLNLINRIIPWFDTIVGGLLIVGLFTRIASLAAATFLVSVIASQPPWIPGTEPTYLYAVELFALLVIFATLAGRYGGLDFFFAAAKKNPAAQEP